VITIGRTDASETNSTGESETNGPGHVGHFQPGSTRTSFGKVHFLALTLGWSRYLWCGYGFQQDLLTLLHQLDQGLQDLGGVPQTLLFDNSKTTVLHHSFRAAAEFHPEFLRFARHYGFRPLACQVRRPQTKGKVERTIGYLHRSFFYARTFHDLDDLNAQCREQKPAPRWFMWVPLTSLRTPACRR